MATHVAVLSFDGYLYLMHSGTGCTHKIDIGEHSYSQARDSHPPPATARRAHSCSVQA